MKIIIEIDISVAELQEIINVDTEDNIKVFNGEQEDLSFLSTWSLNTIYRGVKLYDTHRDKTGFTLSDFNNRVQLKTIELARTYIDNELDNVQG